MNILLILCLAVMLFPAQTLKLYPVDESDRDPSFLELKKGLLRAAETQDAEFLRSVLPPRLWLFDEWKTAEAVVKQFSDEGLWQELRDALRLGVTFDGQAWCAPYVFTELSKATYDDSMVAIVGKGVRVHSEAKSSSPTIAVLSYDIIEPGANYEDDRLKETIGNETYQWREIITPDGKSGYVWGKYVRHIGDFRFFFQLQDGKWKLTGWGAGD